MATSETTGEPLIEKRPEKHTRLARRLLEQADREIAEGDLLH